MKADYYLLAVKKLGEAQELYLDWLIKSWKVEEIEDKDICFAYYRKYRKDFFKLVKSLNSLLDERKNENS